MLTDRHQLQMRKAQVAGIRHQRVGEFAVVQPAPAVRFAPGTQVHFIHRQGRVQRVGCDARRLHRAPGWEPGHHAGRGRPQLGLKGIGVRFEGDQIMGAQNFKLVNVTAHHLGQKDFPHPAAVAQTHGVTPPVPLVETADHRHPLGIGRPDRKARSRHAGAHFRVRTQAFVRPLVRAFGEQPNVRI